MPPHEVEGFGLTVCTAREICATADDVAAAALAGPLLPRGGRLVVVADTGHGKTTFVLQLGGAVLTGADVLGYRGAGVGPIVIVDLEQGTRSIKRSLREAGLDKRDDVIYVRAPDGLALDSDAAHRVELENVVAEHCPAAVIVDPYYKAHRGDPDKERPVVDLMRYLDGLRAKYGFALILPAHPRKVSGNGQRKLTLHDLSGSGAVVRGAEVVIAIERLDQGHARLRILKDRDGDLPVGAEWPLTFERGHGFARCATGARDEWKPTALMERVLGYLHEQQAPVPRSDIERDVKGKRDYLRRAIDTLIADGEIQEHPGSRGARLYEVNPAATRPDVAPPTSEELAPTSPPAEALNEADETTSPHVAPTSPPNGATHLAPSPLPLQGRRGAGRGHTETARDSALVSVDAEVSGSAAGAREVAEVAK